MLPRMGASLVAELGIMEDKKRRMEA